MLADTACDDCGIPFRTPAGGHPDKHRVPRPVPAPETAVEQIPLRVPDPRRGWVVVCSTCNEKRWLALARAKGLI